MALRDNCWEKTEVSSNSHRSSRILDNDSSTYWESTGRNGSHWLRLYMKRGLIIKSVKWILTLSHQNPNCHHFSCVVDFTCRTPWCLV